MLNIVIPMAGKGKRFLDAGYIIPKPFIDVKGQPMIQNVIDNINYKESVRYIFICSECFSTKLKEVVKKELYSFVIIPIQNITEGAACTVLLAKNLIDTDDELVIANCDQLVLDSGFFKNSIEFYRKNKCDGGVLCFLNSSPKWSYIRFEENRITEIIEKKVVSPLATVGIYYYRLGKSFVASAEKMINDNNRVNNEFYVAPTYNYMISQKMKIIPFLVNRMVGLGTPEDLRNYIESN